MVGVESKGLLEIRVYASVLLCHFSKLKKKKERERGSECLSRSVLRIILGHLSYSLRGWGSQQHLQRPGAEGQQGGRGAGRGSAGT